MSRLAKRLDKVRHTDDFVRLVVLDHIGLLDNGHEVLGMANLPLEALPDLGSSSQLTNNFGTTRSPARGLNQLAWARFGQHGVVMRLHDKAERGERKPT